MIQSGHCFGRVFNYMEFWKQIKDYPDYEVSNLGRVKSLSRIILRKGKYPFLSKEKILKPNDNGNGYYYIFLYKNGISKIKYIHKIVAITFLNHNPNGFKLVVNHKNFIKTDNRLENLEIVTQRENANRKHIKSSSKYIGVCWNKKCNKWTSQIVINNNLKYLGLFETELQASNAYTLALKNPTIK